ncbi:MAG: hypothetical protein ACC628_28020, partial [Pirellulaceae bacterium]
SSSVQGRSSDGSFDIVRSDPLEGEPLDGEASSVPTGGCVSLWHLLDRSNGPADFVEKPDAQSGQYGFEEVYYCRETIRS